MIVAPGAGVLEKARMAMEEMGDADGVIFGVRTGRRSDGRNKLLRKAVAVAMLLSFLARTLTSSNRRAIKLACCSNSGTELLRSRGDARGQQFYR
jgi:hypothetical protein